MLSKHGIPFFKYFILAPPGARDSGKNKSPADFLRAGRLTPVAFQKSAGFLSTSQFLPRAAFHGDLRLIPTIWREPDEYRTANSGTGSDIHLRDNTPVKHGTVNPPSGFMRFFLFSPFSASSATISRPLCQSVPSGECLQFRTYPDCQRTENEW